MLYNSQFFLLLFFPLTYFINFLFGTQIQRRMAFLICVSLVFYGFWDYRFVPFLIASVFINWLFSFIVSRKFFLCLAIIFNLSFLIYYKYIGFFLDLLHIQFVEGAFSIIAPLAISFVTFENICFHIDRYRGNAKIYTLLEYAFYITFFPKLIAGPIVRHNEILTPPIFREFSYEDCSHGIMFLFIGLIKKVIISQNLSTIVDRVFNKASGNALSLMDAWGGIISFSGQIYFDFSGYSDMAIGLALLLGVQLPCNFNAPYKATSLQDFWRRWHMTLSRFLRDYLYIPLGGNRNGQWRQAFATVLTMILGGIWHGAGINFLIWGTIHGCCLAINHFFSKTSINIPKFLSHFLTLLVVMVTWVFFRSETFTQSTIYLFSMFQIHLLPMQLIGNRDWLIILGAFSVACIGPTSQEFIMSKHLFNKIVVNYTNILSIIMGLVFLLLLLLIGDGTQKEFIYFQF